MRRTLCSLLGTIMLLTCLGVAASPSPVGAAPTGLELEMVEGGGTLTLRGAEPFALSSPTTVTGTADDETGALSGLALTTPVVSIERKITSPIRATAYIDATFSQVSPGSGTVDSDGNLVAQLDVAVDLDIEVIPEGATEPLPIGGVCRAAPVELILESTAPYDPDTETVTLVDGDFTVPPVAAGSDGCGQIIADNINQELAGSGHSLSLQLQGAIPVPALPGCDTTTDLVVSPEGSSALGEDVTLTSTVATVADDPDCVTAAADGDSLSGAVDFLRGSSIIGSGELDETGTAMFTTGALPAGNLTLTARYRAPSPFSPSTSAPVDHLVTVAPQISTDLPTFVTIGQPTEFTITVTSSGFANDLTDLAVTWSFLAGGNEPKLERFDGTTWQPVTLDRIGRYLVRLPAFDLPAGSTHTERLRLSVGTPDLPPATPDPIDIRMDVVPTSAPLVQPPSPLALAQNKASSKLITTDRVASIFEHFMPAAPIDTHTLRQGETLSMLGFLIRPSAGQAPLAQGTLEFLIDGQVMPTNIYPQTTRPDQAVLSTPVTGGGTGGFVVIQLPPDLPTGERQLTVRYSGDAVYLPHVETYPFTVLPARGPSYDCTGEGIPPIYFRANVVAQANLPQAVEPGTIDLGNLDITLYTDRSILTAYQYFFPYFGLVEGSTQVGERGLKAMSLEVNGEPGTATGVTRTNVLPLAQPRPAPDPDHVVAFDGEAGTAVIAGEPGDLVPVTLDSITLDVEAIGFPYTIRCTPVEEPATMGDVLVAGVDLTVTPNGDVRAGDSVQLTADTGNPADAGVVEFLDGTDTIGVVNVSGGVASMTTTELDAGDHTLRARFYAQPAAPVVVSSEVPLTVLPEFDCGDFTAQGEGRVVRLVYMTLLERCPDQAGYGYWTEQLESGTSQEDFATAISNTDEARRLVANDGYQTMLERDGSDEGLDFWADFLRTRPYRRLLASMGDSPEFRALAGSTDVGFVTRVYRQLLQRAPEPAGLEYWVSRLRAGEPDDVLLTTFSRLEEPTARVVIQSYQEILDRDPTAAELDTQIALLQSNGDRSALYGRLIGTGEFVLRADTLPNFPPET